MINLFVWVSLAFTHGQLLRRTGNNDHSNIDTQTLTLKQKNPPATNTPKNTQAKMPQEAPQQPKKKNKADVHAKKKQHRIDRIAKYWTLFSESEAKPLMIGIKETMIENAKDRELDIPESHIKQGLRSYISRKAYLKALTLGGNRFDMYGQPNGEVTSEQQAVAEQNLAEWNRK